MMSKIKIRLTGIIITGFLLITFQQPVNAQLYNTLYWMKGIPQYTYSNPALQPDAGIFIGFPAVSSLYLNISHSGFAPEDLIKKRETGNSFFIDEQSMLEKLDRRNFLTLDYQHELLAFGFRTGKDYFSFNISEKIGARMGYSRDLMRLLADGNDYFLQQSIASGSDVPAELSGLSLDAIHYREFGLGYSRQWTDRFSAGLRFKALQGMSNVYFERTDLNLITQTNNYELLLQSDILINTSLPFELQPIDSLVNGIDYDPDEDDLIDYATNRQNIGYALDVGASFKLSDKFTIALSAIDLGFINWKSGVENFRATGEFEFEGIDFNDFFDNENDNSFEQIVDSIKDILNFEETNNGYRTLMPAKFFASIAFTPTRAHTFALLARGEYYAGDIYPSFTASYNFHPVPRFGTTFSYSVIHWNYTNVGFGFQWNLGFLQLYAVVDNFFGALQPHTVQTANVHIGVNLLGKYQSRKDPSAPSFRW